VACGCPVHAADGARAALDAEVERRQALEARLAAAESARDENARQLPDLRDTLRRILSIHDDLLADGGEMADKMAAEARGGLTRAGVKGV
jgi:hypothetical protein